MSLVNVYFGEKYDFANDLMMRSKRVGTLEALERAGLKALVETRQVVDEKHLDGDGFWTPTAIVKDE